MSAHPFLPCLIALLCVLHSPAAAQQPQTLADVQIVSVSGCVDQPPVTLNCSVATTTLLVHTAAGFPASVDWTYSPVYIAARLGDYTYFTTNTPWLNPEDSSNSSVYVNISPGGYFPHITGQLVSIYFSPFPASPTTRLTTPAFAAFSFIFDGPPTLASISGCDGSGQSTLSCVPDNTSLTLTGSGFLWLSSAIEKLVTIGSSSSDSVYNALSVTNDSYLTLDLSWIYSSLLQPQHYAGVLLPFSLSTATTTRLRQTEYTYTTNALQISFVPLPPPMVEQWYARQARARRTAPRASCEDSLV